MNNYNVQFLQKLETLISSAGGVVPVMGEPTSFEERSLALLDSLDTAINNISEPTLTPADQVELFGANPSGRPLGLQLNESNGS